MEGQFGGRMGGGMEGVAGIMTGHVINMRREIRLQKWRRERDHEQMRTGWDGLHFAKAKMLKISLK